MPYLRTADLALASSEDGIMTKLVERVKNSRTGVVEGTKTTSTPRRSVKDSVTEIVRVITKTCLVLYRVFFFFFFFSALKIEKVQLKVFDIVLIVAQNIDRFEAVVLGKIDKCCQ